MMVTFAFLGSASRNTSRVAGLVPVKYWCAAPRQRLALYVHANASRFLVFSSISATDLAAPTRSPLT